MSINDDDDNNNNKSYDAHHYNNGQSTDLVGLFTRSKTRLDLTLDTCNTRANTDEKHIRGGGQQMCNNNKKLKKNRKEYRAKSTCAHVKPKYTLSKTNKNTSFETFQCTEGENPISK